MKFVVFLLIDSQNGLLPGAALWLKISYRTTPDISRPHFGVIAIVLVKPFYEITSRLITLAERLDLELLSHNND